MKKFWLIVILIVVFCVMMYLLSNNIPQIKETAGELVTKQKLPIWLAGLLAPIIYLFQAVGKWITNLFAGGGEEKAIEKENERITTELEKISGEVARIDQWRKAEIDIQMKEIERLKQSIGILSQVSKRMDTSIEQLKEKDPQTYSEGMSNKQVFDNLDNFLGLNN